MKIAIVNSRKPRHFQPDEPWLATTMALGYAITRSGHTLSTSVGTIGYEAALFGAAMGQGPIETLVLENDASEIANRLPSCAASNLLQVRVIPGHETQRDREIIHSADLVIAVAVRAGGHMEALLRERWSAGKNLQVVRPAEDNAVWRGTHALLALGVPLVDETWQMMARSILAERAKIPRNEPDWSAFFPKWSDAPLENPTLAHFTRAADGPWPGQSPAEYWEDLWFGGMRARRDAPAALFRILQSSRLVASSRLIRGGFPVVSFTAAAPDQIRELHRYRAHLFRWDFEPWGIVFDRQWLVQKNVRPVRYLPNNAYRALDPDERPWYQKHEPPGCDYSLEQEWRLLGDLDFSNVPSNAARLVVGS